MSHLDPAAAITDTAHAEPDRSTAPATSSTRRALAATWNAVTAVVGGVMGLLPHVLHHVGLLAGAFLVTGATGNALFAVLGLALSYPLLRRLYRRFETWKAPALALAGFTLMFTISALVIGPAINDDGSEPDHTPVQTPDPGEHASHHGG